MKKLIVILTSLILLFIATNVQAGETSVRVDITQEGSGTSSVRVNGEEWRLDGPGEIHVDKITSTTSKPITTSQPEPPDILDSDEPQAIATSVPQESAITQILDKLEEIKSAISDFLSQIF